MSGADAGTLCACGQHQEIAALRAKLASQQEALVSFTNTEANLRAEVERLTRERDEALIDLENARRERQSMRYQRDAAGAERDRLLAEVERLRHEAK